MAGQPLGRGNPLRERDSLAGCNLYERLSVTDLLDGSGDQLVQRLDGLASSTSYSTNEMARSGQP
jgi:hypothetical protein